MKAKLVIGHGCDFYFASGSSEGCEYGIINAMEYAFGYCKAKHKFDLQDYLAGAYNHKGDLVVVLHSVPFGGCTADKILGINDIINCFTTSWLQTGGNGVFLYAGQRLICGGNQHDHEAGQLLHKWRKQSSE